MTVQTSGREVAQRGKAVSKGNCTTDFTDFTDVEL